MNCACNRYKTCTECRMAYKESVKREIRLKNIPRIIMDLEQIAFNAHCKSDYNLSQKIYTITTELKKAINNE